MKFFLKTHCPVCHGPVTFFEVMSIITPFESIDCSSCGEKLFLKHQLRAVGLSVIFGLLVFVGAFYAAVESQWPILGINLGGAALLIVLEFLLTARIVHRNDLVVRQKISPKN